MSLTNQILSILNLSDNYISYISELLNRKHLSTLLYRYGNAINNINNLKHKLNETIVYSNIISVKYKLLPKENHNTIEIQKKLKKWYKYKILVFERIKEYIKEFFKEKCNLKLSDDKVERVALLLIRYHCNK